MKGYRDGGMDSQYNAGPQCRTPMKGRSWLRFLAAGCAPDERPRAPPWFQVV